MRAPWCFAATLSLCTCKPEASSHLPPTAPAASSTWSASPSPQARPPSALAGGELLVATQGWRYDLVILHVRADEVVPEVAAPASRHDYGQFGWLDARTLVYYELTDGDRSRVRTFVDGTPATALELDARWLGAKLLITSSGEAWVERCVDDDCHASEYERAIPAPHVASRTRPADVDARRVAHGGETRDELSISREAKAPAGITLAKIALPPHSSAIRCTRDGQATQDPRAANDDRPYRVTSTRWVLAEPPVYEVTAEVEVIPGEPRVWVADYIACHDQPLAGFVSFGGGLWAEYVEAADHEDGGEWVLRDGTRELGRYDGGPGQLRANRVLEP